MIVAHDAPRHRTSAPGPDVATAAHQRDLPGLDGLRAIAVVLVILSHAVGDFASGNALRPVAVHGAFGVTIFFVLSGYLITYLLLREEDRMGGIDLGRFLARRSIRIAPPAFVLVATLMVLAWLGWFTLEPAVLASLLLFYRNLVSGPWVTSHLWSLAVEEHFYLAWPLVFVACRSPKWRASCIGLAIMAAPIWRAVVIRRAGGAWAVNGQRTDLTCDAILMGCLLALATRLPSWERCLGSRALRHPAASCLAVAVLIGTFTATFDAIPKSGGVSMTLRSLCVAIVINQVVRAPGGLITRCLSLAALAWLGRLSYSVYLWQQLFCCPAWPASESRFLHLPWNLVPIMATAMLSYYVVEKPLFRLRARFRPVRSRRGPMIVSRPTTASVCQST